MLRLPKEDGTYLAWRPSGVAPIQPGPGGFSSRVAYAAAHVVASNPPGAESPTIDWEATLAYREYLWDLGLGVAEAMDTAQRGSGLAAEAAEELIRRTAGLARSAGPPAVYGAATDRLESGQDWSYRQIADAYSTQVELIERLGGTAILMASRQLAAAAGGPKRYLDVYREVIAGASRPVLIHWLGEMFDPALAGYWGSRDLRDAAKTVLELVSSMPDRIAGLKLSVLDDGLEQSLRRRLPSEIRMFTGDDLNFVDLIEGDAEGHSDALLGVLGPIAPAAVAAFQALDQDDRATYRRILEPTLPMARHLFSHPTYHYKTGVAFLTYINGLQPHFRMLGNAELARSVPHLARLLILADRAGLILQPNLAESRMESWLRDSGSDI